MTYTNTYIYMTYTLHTIFVYMSRFLYIKREKRLKSRSEIPITMTYV